MSLGNSSIGLNAVYNVPTSGFQSVYLATNQVLTADVYTVLSFLNATTEQNNPSTIISVNGSNEISPLLLNDVLLIDMAFIAVVPATGNQWINLGIRVKSTGLIYRSTTIFMIKGVGDDDPMAASFSVPIGASLANEKLELVVNPSHNTTIKQKYACVTRVHKGVN